MVSSNYGDNVIYIKINKSLIRVAEILQLRKSFDLKFYEFNDYMHVLVYNLYRRNFDQCFYIHNLILANTKIR